MSGTASSSTPWAARTCRASSIDLWTFLVIIAVLLALTVAQTFLQESLKFRLREWITRHLLVEWLKPMRVYQLSFAGQYGHNPDQRIQEDTRLLGDYTADLGCGIVYSLLQIVAFVGVLWALSAQVTFQVAGYDIAIPGYMVWCALAYALIGSGSDLARGAAADCPEWRAICARGGIPLRPRPGQRIRREHRAAWRGEGRTTPSRSRARGRRRYHAANILLPRPPDLDHVGHRLAVARRSDPRGRAGLFRRQPDPRRPDHGGRRLQPGAGGDAMVRRQLFAACRLACGGPSGRALPRSARRPAGDRRRRRGNQTRAAPGRTSCFRGRAHPPAGRTHHHRGRDRQHHAGRARADRRRHRKRKIDAVPRRGGPLAVGFRDNPHACRPRPWHSCRSAPICRWARCATP